VDFDTSLNTVIRKLRSALADVAETPRYIETLPRRGYRFIGALDPDSASTLSASPARVALSDPGVHKGPAPSAGLAALQEPTPAARLETAPAPAPGTAAGPVRVAICVLPFRTPAAMPSSRHSVTASARTSSLSFPAGGCSRSARGQPRSDIVALP
jgi:hypothetical protein